MSTDADTDTGGTDMTSGRQGYGPDEPVSCTFTPRELIELWELVRRECEEGWRRHSHPLVSGETWSEYQIRITGDRTRLGNLASRLYATAHQRKPEVP